MRLYYMLAYFHAPEPPNPILVDMFDMLVKRGNRVEIGVAEDLVAQPDRIKVKHDLYVLKSHSDLWLSLAGVIHSQGARILNPYRSCMAVYNKIVTSQYLRAAGVPVPLSWVTGDLNLLASLAAERPLVVKPCVGGRGREVHMVRHPGELANLPPPQQPWLVQELVPGPGQDLKLYVIGDQVFGVRKPFSETSFKAAGEPCAVDDAVREIALRCGQTLGLGLYGLDVIESPSGPVVVDVNYFPSYKGVPDAARLLADYTDEYAHGRHGSLSLQPTLAGRPLDATREGTLPVGPMENPLPVGTWVGGETPAGQADGASPRRNQTRLTLPGKQIPA